MSEKWSMSYGGTKVGSFDVHVSDEDCEGHIDPETLCCSVCGVDHNCECPKCGGHGFHKADCLDNGEGTPVDDDAPSTLAEE
jgi:hypothetical protein